MSDCCGIGNTVIKKLHDVDKAIDELFIKLSRAVDAICTGAAQPERRAA